MKVTLRQIEILVAAAEEEHFGRAAERLYISQPSVSKEVRHLEQALHATFFFRSTRGVTLTDDGRHAAQQAAEILERVRQLERSMADRGDAGRTRRTVTIAASPSIVDDFLPAAVSLAEDALPDVWLSSRDVETGEVARAVAESRADIGLGHFVATQNGLERESISNDAVVGVLRHDHPAADGNTLDLGELRDLPLLIWPREINPAYYDFLISVCESMGLHPYILTAPPKVMGLRSYFLTEGRAFALFAEGTAPRISRGLTALPLAHPTTLPLDMTWRQDDAPDPTLRAVREFLKDAARNHRTGPDQR
jgi:DNA-binding transcriptional LysR family regulator